MKRLFMNLGVLQIFFSLLIVISIMFVSTYFVYRNSISGIYEKVSENNTLVVKSVVQSFDNDFTTINNIISTIDNMQPLNSMGSTLDAQLDMSKVYTMVDNLSGLVSSIDFIEEVVVFYEDSNLAITSTGTTSFQLLFDKKYKHEIHNSNYWRTYALSKHALKIFPAEVYVNQTEGAQKNKKKNLIFAMGGNKFQMTKNNVMIIIDVAALMKHTNQKSMIPGASMIVLDQNKNVILSTDQNWDLVEVLNDVYFNSNQEATLTRGDYEYNFHKSDYNDYIYIDKVPYQFQNLDSVAEANNLIMLTAIISAIILSVFLSIYLNRPVNNILRLLGGGTSKGNDFRKIYSGVVKIQTENQSYKDQISYADEELRRVVFLQSLDEYKHSKEHDILLQKYDLDFFSAKHFIMAIIQVNENDRDYGFSIPVEQITEKLHSSMRRESIDGHIFYGANAQFIMVIGHDDPKQRKLIIRQLQAFIVRAEKEDFIGFSLWSCVSKVYSSETKNFRRAYRDVMNGLIYRNVNDKVKVTDVDEIRYVWSIHLPFEDMEKLSNYVLHGKEIESVQIIKEIMNENIQRDIHHHQFVHIAKTILFYLLKYVGGHGTSLQELYELERDFYRKVDHAQNYQGVENALIDVVKQFSAQRIQTQMNKLNPTFISQYIELHYMENMYLDHIAEVMETSPKYFSSYFKKTFGVNYVEYVNKVRLAHARELLKETNLTIAEIGEKIGYLNASTFTTTFKKYLGVSPSVYRNTER
ncbi:helix-turn-helix domain-containing protein [Paenibacillus sp. CMAA1364]